MTTTEMPATISVRAAAKRLGIGVRAAYRACADNTLPHLRFGRRIVVPLRALEAFERDAYPGKRDGNAGKREATAE